jgi:hypothetical protein
MRDLYEFELQHVSGAGSSPCPPSHPPRRSKGNNGYGNGGHDGVPGNSGKTGGGKAQDRIR